MKLKLSIIITVYNNSIYLNRCINSILKQSILPFEIIIIDDGSKKKIKKKEINQIKKSIKTIFFLRKKNYGPSSARNLGLKIARGNLVTFFDVDDEMLPNYIEKKINFLKKKNTDKIIGVYSQEIRENKKINYLKKIPNKPNIDLIGKYKNGLSARFNNYVLIKKNIKKLGGLDENLKINEDFDFFIRAIKNNYKIYAIDNFDVKINLSPNSLTRSRNITFRYTEQKKFLQKAKIENYFSKAEQNKRELNLEKMAIKEFIIIQFNIIFFLKHLFNYIKIFLKI